jgi:hypothetical protein
VIRSRSVALVCVVLSSSVSALAQERAPRRVVEVRVASDHAERVLIEDTIRELLTRLELVTDGQAATSADLESGAKGAPARPSVLARVTVDLYSNA